MSPPSGNPRGGARKPQSRSKLSAEDERAWEACLDGAGPSVSEGRDGTAESALALSVEESEPQGRSEGADAGEVDPWTAEISDVTPLHPRKAAAPAEPEPEPPAQIDPPAPAAAPAPPKPKIPKFRIGQNAPSGAAVPRHKDRDAPQEATGDIDAKVLRRLRRGEGRIEDRLDLHGMNMDQAERAVCGFVRESARRGRRLILIITGKGRDAGDTGPVPARIGVLRQSLPRWLDGPQVGEKVQGWLHAHRRDGGTGAFYVYLRRSRQ